jgi:phenylalanyl-tRNA synthetase beta chain
MHCFDADEIHGDIIIRNATAGEEFTDLFGANHILQESDLVIADDKGILALAGVVGGARGMTKDTTENIILESAYFSPIGIRKTRRRLGLSTDASYRYERGIDPTVTGEAIDMAAGLIMTECGGEIANSQQQKAQSSKPTAIDYSFDLFKKKTGIELSKEKQIKILERLGYHVTCHMSHVTLTPPAYRIDIEIPENIVSDLIRIYGYENIPAYVQPVLRADMRPLTALKEQLAARGLSEHISMGFGSSAAEMAVYGETGVRIANPIADFLDVARFGLIPNMLQAIADNERRGYADLAMFEYGTTFWGDAPGEQQKQLLIARTGSAVPRHWTHRTRKADIYDVKADLIALDVGARGNAPGSDWTIETNNPPKWAHPYRYGRMVRDGKTIAEFGELHPSVAKYFKIKTNVVLAIVYESQVTNHEPRTTNHDLQPIHRDFAFEVDADFPAGKIVSLAVSVDKRIIDIIVFDAFDLGSGKKSIGFTITIQPEANMSDTDILEIQNAVIEAVEKNTPARIRDGQ